MNVNINRHLIILVALCVLLLSPTYASNLSYSKYLTKKFYKQNSQQLVWSHYGYVKSSADDMMQLISHAKQYNLNPNDYHIHRIRSLREKLSLMHLFSSSDRAHNLNIFDHLLTKSALRFSADLAYGNPNVAVTYPRWHITKKNINLIAILNNYNTHENINHFLHKLLPTYRGYYKLNKQLLKYKQLAKHGGWPIIPGTAPLRTGSHNKRIVLLQKHLLITGELHNIGSNESGLFDHKLQQAVIQFQKNNGLTPDGVVGPQTLRTLNIPINKRILQIEANMNRLRYLPHDMKNPYVLVNIPDFSLRVIHDNHNVLDMPVIVGTNKRQTCIVNSNIIYLTLNPYWNIPKSIAIKEILPHLQQDPDYLYHKNIEVFTKVNGKKTMVDPTSINWQEVESSNFPYHFRQTPGDENALGNIKFAFQNNCSMFLHDTNMPQLFKNSRRAFSHGCIRIAKPIALANYLLKQNNGSWSQKKIEKKIKTGQRRVITLNKPIAVYIIYATAWVNSNGTLQFRPDIYHADPH